MDKRQRAQLFRTRLQAAQTTAGLSTTALARQVGIDRSTLAQLLTGASPRLPNGQTVAELASVLKVSTDWLLGLSAASQGVADILDASFQIARSQHRPVDENILRWFSEAAGQKIRNVPTTLPEPFKIAPVLRHEYADTSEQTSDLAIASSRDRLAQLRLSDSDMEFCLAEQEIESFAAGAGIWHGLAAAIRQEQLARMARLARELYPRIRLYLYDARRQYSAAFLVFGTQKAAIYLGQTYFVFTTTGHIRTLSDQFDALVRAATVQAHESPDWIAAIAAADGG